MNQVTSVLRIEVNHLTHKSKCLLLSSNYFTTFTDLHTFLLSPIHLCSNLVRAINEFEKKMQSSL